MNLEDRVKTGSHQTAKKDEIAASTIQALTSELRTTKQSLEETTKREHQVSWRMLRLFDTTFVI